MSARDQEGVGVVPQLCPCGSEYRTVEVSVGKKHRLVGKHCAAMLEMVADLVGEELRQRPILSVVRGSVE